MDIRVPLFIDKHTVIPDGSRSPPLSNGNVGESTILFETFIVLNLHAQCRPR